MNKALLRDHGGESSLNKAIFPEGIGMGEGGAFSHEVRGLLEMILVK